MNDARAGKIRVSVAKTEVRAERREPAEAAASHTLLAATLARTLSEWVTSEPRPLAAFLSAFAVEKPAEIADPIK